MSWFDVADGRLRFRGRITRQPILEWVASTDGVKAVDAAARAIRFSLFGRTRAARRRIGRALWEAMNAPALRDTVAAECDRYVAAWTELAYAPALPRLTIALHRLVVVPRALIIGRSSPGACTRVAASFETPPATEPFKTFLGRWILGQMEVAIRRAEPSPRRPLHARESWACVAMDRKLVWIDPQWTGADWRGHALLFEIPVGGLQRRDRHKLEEAIRELQQSVSLLSRLERDGVVHLASDQMQTLTF